MSLEVIGVIVAVCAATITLLGGIGSMLAWGLRRIDARFEKVDARFDRVDERFDRLEADIVELKVAVARLEGPLPRLATPPAR